MFYPVQCDQPAQVRLTVNSAQASRGWGKRLRMAGWRSFVRASGRDSSVMTCILKRGATAVMLTQSAVVAIDPDNFVATGSRRRAVFPVR